LYPYVSTFPILYLKALANSKDIRLESEIEKYAYRISSRAVLFDLLNERQELQFEQIATTEVEPILVQQDEVVQVESDLVPEPEVIVESDILEEVSQVEIVPESEATVLSEPEIVEEIVQFEEEIVPESEAIVLSEPEIIEEIRGAGALWGMKLKTLKFENVLSGIQLITPFRKEKKLPPEENKR
jgi:hypothetical protein